MQKTVRKNSKYSRNKTVLKINHHGKAITFANNKIPKKIVKMHCASHLESFCAKNCSTKYQIFDLLNWTEKDHLSDWHGVLRRTLVSG